MSLTLISCRGGQLVLPEPGLLLATRIDGGNLVVNPPRAVWERSELSADELQSWSFLIASAGRAMIDVLEQLDGGCINYWEAGNWALNDDAEPKGRKRAADHRRVHLHLLGRNPRSTNPDWRWGESPRFPQYAERHTWASGYERLTPEECGRVVARAEEMLISKYGFDTRDIEPWRACESCGYPSPVVEQQGNLCRECRPWKQRFT